MLTTKKINRIYEMKKKRVTNEAICKALSISNKTVVKYSKTEQKEPTTPYLLERIEALEGIIGVLKDKVIKLETLRTPLPTSPQNKSTQLLHNQKGKSTLKVHTQETEKVNHNQRFTTSKELMKKSGFLKERAIQERCKKAGYKKVKGQYMIPVRDMENFRNKKLDFKVEP